MRSVRRHLYPQQSAPGRGIVWEWLNDDGIWTAYEMSICEYLEQQLAGGNQLIDLSPLGYNYEVDSSTYTQVNKTSSFRRRVQRRQGPTYPVTAVIAVPGHTGMACSCQQCLANSGSGPVNNRYRHSMTHLPAYVTPQPAHRTAPMGIYTGYAPYSKPSLSGARSAPRLNVSNSWSMVTPVMGVVPVYPSSLPHLVPQRPPPGPAPAKARYFILSFVILHCSSALRVWAFHPFVWGSLTLSQNTSDNGHCMDFQHGFLRNLSRFGASI